MNNVNVILVGRAVGANAQQSSYTYTRKMHNETNTKKDYNNNASGGLAIRIVQFLFTFRSFFLSLIFLFARNSQTAHFIFSLVRTCAFYHKRHSVRSRFAFRFAVFFLSKRFGVVARDGFLNQFY